MLHSIEALLSQVDRFREKEETKAEVEVLILDKVFNSLPTPPFTADEKKSVTADV
ncbi:MAG: hypothetical protein OXL41_08460 [Nitrospinae bacterium]|nr:hypothetical protein [Nitrospinota bacterium]